jgi:hypothetical protein
VAPGSSFCGTKSSANQILLEASTARLGFINIKLSRLCGCVQMKINTKHKHHSTQFLYAIFAHHVQQYEGSGQTL